MVELVPGFNHSGETSAVHLFEMATRAEGAVSSLSDSARSLWAKTGDESGWLNLPQHLVDSLCAAEAVWDIWVAPSVRKTLARLAKLDEGEVRTLYLWLAAGHDLGKATLSFARQVENSADGESFVNRIADAGLPLVKSSHEENMAKFPHGLGSRVVLRRWLREQGVPPRVAGSLVEVADAHHGIPSDERLRDAAHDVVADYDPAWQRVHAELLEMVAELTGIADVLPRISKPLTAPALQLLTGMVIMSDWIASSTDAFPMTVQDSQVERARHGMEFIELTEPWRAAAFRSEDIDAYLQASFGWPAEYNARPVQRDVVKLLERAEGPTLTIIEAPTGEGKTEAALAAVQMIVSRGGNQGTIFAAPTMSTANGLFDRVVEWSARNTPESEISSMFLAHSKANLSESFRKLKFNRIGDEEPRSGTGSAAANRSGQVVASQWLSGRKKGILSNFVVATVDQVLLMALQSRHSMLRHVGLAGKVVVIDEAHAYDTYMSAYLATALQWLARYGASVILMSATLPVAQKTALAKAYGGQVTRESVETDSTAYPLVTVVSKDGVTQQEVESRPADLHAWVELIPDDLAELVGQLDDRLAEGGCVLIVCNTIRRAQTVYQALSDIYPADVELHHAAFMANERSDKEDHLREQLGPGAHRADGSRPWRKVVVATQVAEQSLDIDADLLVTDIAPMDLIIQRIGRLHRHQRPAEDRPERLRDPEVLIRGIVAHEPSPEFEGGTAFIYDPAILLATLAVLQERVVGNGFQRPGDIAPLVHTTYSSELAAPAGWEDVWDEARTESRKQQQLSASRAKSYRFPEPRLADSLDKLFARYFDDVDTAKGEEAGLAQVRDSDPTVEVIPILDTAYGYLPLGEDPGDPVVDEAVPDNKLVFRLASSTVRLPAKFSKYDWMFEPTIDQLELETPLGWAQHFMLKGQVALRLDESYEIELAGKRLRYSHELGLEEVEEVLE